ncbi:hypothetical protein ACJJTC_012976 [Scirpophaga incertulas]
MAAIGSGRGTMDSQNQVSSENVDRLKLLYPNVNEEETPLPRAWSTKDKFSYIGLSQNNLRVHYKGKNFQGLFMDETTLFNSAAKAHLGDVKRIRIVTPDLRYRSITLHRLLTAALLPGGSPRLDRQDKHPGRITLVTHLKVFTRRALILHR